MVGNYLDDQVWVLLPLGIWEIISFKASSARPKVISHLFKRESDDLCMGTFSSRILI